MILHSIICFAMLCSTQAIGVAGSAAADSRAVSTLQDDFSQVMLTIREKSPVLYRHLQKMPREKALQSIFRALNSGVLSEASYTAVQQKQKKIKNQFFYSYLPDKRLFYLRTDRLDYAAIRNVLQKHDRYSALILDLRTASGDDYDSVLPMLHFLRSKKHPVALLTGNLTSGAPELFCAMAAKQDQFITMGQPGSGQMFPMIKAGYWFGSLCIPEIREEFALIFPGGMKPKMHLQRRARITKAGLKNPVMLQRDGLLTFAGDFLISRLVLRVKK